MVVWFQSLARPSLSFIALRAGEFYGSHRSRLCGGRGVNNELVASFSNGIHLLMKTRGCEVKLGRAVIIRLRSDLEQFVDYSKEACDVSVFRIAAAFFTAFRRN